jgi:hypothetical protein
MTHRKLVAVLSGMLLFAGFSATSFSQKAEHEDFDSYKLRIDADWYYANPSGYLEGTTSGANVAPIDLNKDLGFPTYSTFAGKADWKFTRKNHLYLAASPFNMSHSTVLNRTFTFQGQTFTAGLTSSSSLNTVYWAPGYQYDFIRRKRGHLGLALQMDLFNSKASINAAAQTTADGVHHAAVSASGSLLAPVPVAGPDFRFYVTNSPKVFVQGNLFGMYLFGYGNFISSGGSVGLNLSKHFAATAGYQLGSHLEVNNASDRIGFHFTQKGAIVGLETSF